MPDDSHLVEVATGRSEALHLGFLDVRRDEVRLPDGSNATREYIRHPGAVAIVPLLGEGPDPRLVLVRQYRYPLAKVLLELPAGKLDAGETQLDCARRELQEETGYMAQEWAYGGEVHNAAAYSTESIWIWFARGLTAGPKRPDPGEFVETVTHTVTELQSLADREHLPDVKTQIGLHWLQRWQGGHIALHWQSAGTAATV